MEKKYYKHKLENLLVISKIVTVHYFEFDKNFVGHTEAHDFWELVYAERGDIVCLVDQREVALKEGEVIFYQPGLIHALRADGNRAPNVFIVSFECRNEAMRFFENRHMKLDPGLLHFVFSIIEESKRSFDLPYSDPMLKKMKPLEHPALGAQQLLKNYLELLLISLMRNESEKSNSTAMFVPIDRFNERISDQVIDYMKEHVTERLSVADVCAILHYNKSYVFRQFKKTTGYTLMSYFMRLKVERAKELLRETKMSVGDISDALSFESANYFSKKFKNITGYTPSTYRKMKRMAMQKKGAAPREKAAEK